MIKKMFMFTTVFLILLFVNNQVFAIDLLLELREGNQKAIFLGEIESIEQDSIIIKPTNILMGELEEKKISVPKFKYAGILDEPKKGDYMTGVLIRDNLLEEMFTFKATSLDEKTLELYHPVDNPNYGYSHVQQANINNRNFFEAQQKLNKTTNQIDKANNVLDITPPYSGRDYDDGMSVDEEIDLDGSMDLGEVSNLPLEDDNSDDSNEENVERANSFDTEEPLDNSLDSESTVNNGLTVGILIVFSLIILIVIVKKK